jgi:hypothetical protein
LESSWTRFMCLVWRGPRVMCSVMSENPSLSAPHSPAPRSPSR